MRITYAFSLLFATALLIESCRPDNDDQPNDNDSIGNYDTFYVNDTFKRYWFQEVGFQKVFRRTDRMDTFLTDTAIIISQWDTLVFDIETETIRQDCGVEIQHSYDGYNKVTTQLLSSTMTLGTLDSRGFIARILLDWPPRSNGPRNTEFIEEFVLNKDTFHNTYHSKSGTFEVWLAKDIGIVKVILDNGHVWELSNLKS